MQSELHLAFALKREDQQAQLRDAAHQRLVNELPSTPSIRRTVGRRIASIGARIAAEPSLELARSR